MVIHCSCKLYSIIVGIKVPLLIKTEHTWISCIMKHKKKPLTSLRSYPLIDLYSHILEIPRYSNLHLEESETSQSHLSHPSFLLPQVLPTPHTHPSLLPHLHFLSRPVSHIYYEPASHSCLILLRYPTWELCIRDFGECLTWIKWDP